ncbi:MAG TPA: hypothetical protein VIH64_04270 [Streptosporangiaceae bacterium]
MTATWTPEQLQRIDGSDELEIASRRADGTLRPLRPRLGRPDGRRPGRRRDLAADSGHAS